MTETRLSDVSAWRRRLAVAGHYGIVLGAGLPGTIGTVVSSVYLITVVGADPLVVGLFANAGTILGMLVTYYAGRGRIDQRSPVAIIVWSMSIALVATVLLLLAPVTLWVLVLVVLLRALTNLLSPAIYMFDERYRPPLADENAGMYYTRLVISMVWIVGPPVGFFVFWIGEYPLITLVSGVLTVLACAAVLYVAATRQPHAAPTKAAAKPVVAGARPAMDRWQVFTIMVCVTAANVLHSMAMPLYQLQQLGAEPYWPGFNMAVAASTEVVVIYCIPILLKRTTEEVLLRIGLGIGLVYFLLLFVVRSPVPILFMQVIYGAHFALSTVVCLGLLKTATQQKIGAVAAQFLNAGKLGGLIGASIFGLFAARLSFGGVLSDFGLALIVAAAVLALVVSQRRVVA
ncbi:MFS transporter [Devosia sp.]|uniref:MFS transporter n=1 Tax=Devosia sp. TaxID=1871048 RepID=UPI0032639B4B